MTVTFFPFTILTADVTLIESSGRVVVVVLVIIPPPPPPEEKELKEVLAP